MTQLLLGILKRIFGVNVCAYMKHYEEYVIEDIHFLYASDSIGHSALEGNQRRYKKRTNRETGKISQDPRTLQLLYLT